MLSIFQFCGNLLTQVVVYWQGVSIGGFRPFWYLIGCFLLTVFGFFIRGLLFSGAGGSSASSIARRVNVKVNKNKGGK